MKHLLLFGAVTIFRLFLLGIKFELFTDHKALLQIYSHTSKPSARIEGWVSHLQQFDFEIKYKKEIENPANALLRLSIWSKIEKSCSVTDKYVNFIIETRSQSINIDKIRHETQMDNTLNLIIKPLKGCAHYIFASLFFNSKRGHLWNKEKWFLFHLESSFHS